MKLSSKEVMDLSKIQKPQLTLSTIHVSLQAMPWELVRS